MALSISGKILSQSIEELRVRSDAQRESMLLWLAGIQDREKIVSVYVPQYTSRMDQFWISREGMQRLLDHLRSNKLFIAAQMHTHPREAYHSEADNRWAIVRHEGALSTVLPDFALNVSLDNFCDIAAVFEMRAGQWTQVSATDSFLIGADG